VRRLALFLFVLPSFAMAETVQISGPLGPLEAELIAVEGARNAVIIIPGSGPTDRDGNSRQLGLATDSYKLLAEGLAAGGIASLRIDKRGLFGSASAVADANAVTLSDYAGDAESWLQYAAGLAPCVWIAGHSEGGLVALATAETAPEPLCGLILLATPGRLLGRLMVDQLQANPANAPLMPEINAIVADLEAGRRRDPETISQVLLPLFSGQIQGYLIDLFSFDPAGVAGSWQGPALIVQGDSDAQVLIRDAELLAAAMPQAQSLGLRGGTHMLKVAVPGVPLATYTDPSLPLHEDLIPAITHFVAEAIKDH
jgi:pimeloyl-ACP methyl ester carboxylesterase